MSEFRILLALSTADAAELADFHRVAAAALAFDGYSPFNEQALFDLQAGRRTAYLVRAPRMVVSTGSTNETVDGPDEMVSTGSTNETADDPDEAISTGSTDGTADGPDEMVSTRSTNETADGPDEVVSTGSTDGKMVSTSSTDAEGGSGGPTDGADALVVGAALGGRGEIDLVISPEYRRRGYGRAAARELVGTDPNRLTAWAHGDHPGARALASELRFVAARTLLELRKPLPGPAEAASALAGGESISAFRVGADDAEWVQLNALVFAAHPEQGAITEADLAARQAESWFTADDFLILRDKDGRMIGYNWLKVDGPIGEIYVIGVHPDAAGRGVGRVLMQAGLQRLVDAGCTTAALYVEADSLGPVHLYRTLGFVDHTVDVQYQRLTV